MTVPSLATSKGLVNPYSTMLAASCATCAALCVRGLREYGAIRSIGQRSTVAGSVMLGMDARMDGF